MISFFNEHLGRHRSIVWLTTGVLIALLAGLVAVGPRVLRSRQGWHPESESMPDRSALAQAATGRDATGPLDRGVRAGSPGSVPGARKSSGTSGGAASGVRPGRSAGDRGAVGGEPNAPGDADVALFAALERLERRIAGAIASARESVVALEYTAPDAPPGTRRVATGVVINQRGEVLSVRIDQPPTSRAPVAAKNASVIVARDVSGRCHTVHWVAADPETGLTLLRLPPRAVRPIRASSGRPSLGSQVFVVGNPFGMGHSVSRGHVAGLDRALELGPRQLGGLIQVQVPLYPGDSGAALVNLHGDWLGLIRSGLAIPGSGLASGSEGAPATPLPGSMAQSELSPSLDPTDISLGRPERDTDFGFAIPVQDALWVADQLRTRGRVDRAYLGVRLEPSSAAGLMAGSESERRLETASSTPPSETPPQTQAAIPTRPDRSLAVADEGAILREVLTGTPASQAGLRPGDGIVELDGQPIRSAHDLTDRLDRIPSHSTILLGVVRDRGPRRQRISLSLCTASRPEVPPVAAVGSTPAAASIPAIPDAPTPPPLDVPPGPAAVVAAPSVNPPISTHAEAAVPAPQPNELRLTLPRAIVDRLEKLERRLEKLESFPSRATGHVPAPDRQISSARNP